MWGGPPPPMTPMTPEQMMQMMQMQGWMQMQQQMAQQTAATTAASQPPVQPAAVTQLVTRIMLVEPSKDGTLTRAKGQRTSVPIKVELNDAQEPTGSYCTALSLRMKAANSFPEAGTDCAWKLYIGELAADGKPSEVSFIGGNSEAETDSNWREQFSCKVIEKLEPVVFVNPCLSGHEGKDVDRKRAAGFLETDAAEVKAAMNVLSTARPTKVGKQSGKQVVQLQVDERVARLRQQVQALVDKSKSAQYLNSRTGQPIFILTDGKWVRPVFSSDRKTVVTAGFFSEMSVESIDGSFLDTDGTLIQETLWFACTCCPSLCPPLRRGAALSSQSTVATWQKWAVATESSKAKTHSSSTKAGGVVLKSFQSMVKYHMDTKHGGSLATVESKNEQFARACLLGSALLQTPGSQAALQEAVAAQREQAAGAEPTLTPADPPEPPPIVLRYPFDAAADAKERDAVAIPLADITSSKLAAGSMVSWRVYDLLRRYELQCAINSGLSSEQVALMPPYDFLQIDRQMVLFQNKNNVVIDLSTRVGSTFPVFQLLSSLQKQVNLVPSSSRDIYQNPFGELQFVSIPVLYGCVHSNSGP